MSFAPRDTHEAQVQFALERGVPAMIGVLASNRLPYPSRAFDMAHCSRCLIPWQLYGELINLILFFCLVFSPLFVSFIVGFI
jgi:Putative S-adenosyl-L-methionine-dependent methyltransferase